jgi:hypothetical protein
VFASKWNPPTPFDEKSLVSKVELGDCPSRPSDQVWEWVKRW